MLKSHATGIRVRFSQDIAVAASAPFVVDIEDSGRRAATIGYDMHPERKFTVEVAVYPGAPPDDYRRIARRMAENVSFRRNHGIKPGRISRVQRSSLRN